VYNPATSHVTAQFHVTFDDTFSSVASIDATVQDATISSLLDKTSWLHSDEYGPPSAHHYFASDTALPIDAPRATPAVPLVPKVAPTSCQAYKPVRASQAFDAWKAANGIAAEVFVPVPLTPPQPKSTDSATITSPNRRLPHCRAAEGAHREIAEVSAEAVSEGDSPQDPSSFKTPTVTHTYPTDPAALSFNFSPTSSGDKYAHLCEGAFPLYAYPASPHPCDTLTQSAMLKASDQSDFITAQASEIHGLHSSGVFSYHKIETLPARARLLNAIWSYRRKRSPAGVLLKHKARICTDGSQQQYGVDYWETYAPVVSWSTVRLLLSLASIHGWKSHQIDFTQAFTQPPIDEDIYMRIPQGWHVVGDQLAQHESPKFRDCLHYIKLKKSLYGIKQAARAWFHFLEPGLTKLGFQASDVDPCLFYRKDCIIVLYVDDCLIFSPTQSTVDEVVAALHQDYHIGSQGSVQDFLGIHILSDAAGATHFTQPGLISSILQDLNLDTCHNKYTPAISVLHPDHGGHARCEPWNYRSVLGKLNYLAQMTRPDISMAVHNCARFTTAPTYLHEQAVKRIGRYLSATRHQGLIYRPTTDGSLNMYVDADFAGTWHKEFSHLRDCVMSRTGYVILYSGCPIHWGSKLQTEIALSTTEAEYIALSTAARELIPIRRLLRELTLHSPLREVFQFPPGQLPPSTIFEDNASCIAIATKDNHHKPRTKHISLKYHHFKDYLKTGALSIAKVSSADNLADIFTKPLTQVLHDRLRTKMMGW
jgi:hypothetical protein